MADVTAQIRAAAGRAVPLVEEHEVRVVALCDGFAGIQSDRFPTLEPEAARVLAADGGVALDDMAVSVNGFLVESGGRRCLVDAGNGHDPRAEPRPSAAGARGRRLPPRGHRRRADDPYARRSLRRAL